MRVKAALEEYMKAKNVTLKFDKDVEELKLS
jgi:hypothetical protein